MKKLKLKNMQLINKKGFTLVELMITVAIIGILASIVLVSTSTSVEKSKRASAIASASSVLPELVACQDDVGFAKSTAIVAGDPVCCTNGSCGTAFSGHTVTWPNVNTKAGWSYSSSAPTGTLAAGTYSYTLTKSGQTSIICNYATNDCN